MPISKKTLHYAPTFVLSVFFTFISACSENNEAALEVFEPMSCTFPGKLELDRETKQRLSDYALPR